MFIFEQMEREYDMKQNIWMAIKEFDDAYSLCRKGIMKKYDLSAIEVDVLLFLYNNQQYTTAAEISFMRKIPKSHVSLAVNGLFEKGYIEKIQDQSNKKKIHLIITSKAKDIIDYSLICQKEFADALIEGFSRQEMESFIDFLARMRKNVKEYSKKH